MFAQTIDTKKDGHTAKPISGAGAHSHGCQEITTRTKFYEIKNEIKKMKWKKSYATKHSKKPYKVFEVRCFILFFNPFFISFFMFGCFHFSLFLLCASSSGKKGSFWLPICAPDLHASRSHATTLQQPIANCWPVGAPPKQCCLSTKSGKPHARPQHDVLETDIRNTQNFARSEQVSSPYNFKEKVTE